MKINMNISLENSFKNIFKFNSSIIISLIFIFFNISLLSQSNNGFLFFFLFFLDFKNNILFEIYNNLFVFLIFLLPFYFFHFFVFYLDPNNLFLDNFYGKYLFLIKKRYFKKKIINLKGNIFYFYLN
jgi:hypothetical protein